MSAVNPKQVAMARERQSEAGPIPGSVRAYPEPPPRDIPLPEFYPREKTSTASYKAPVTASGLAAKKKLEPPPPPPASTLGTAMNYFSSTTPVKYISSMFTKPPPPEPVKVKEKVFKFDLEKLEKEKMPPPKSLSYPKKETTTNTTAPPQIKPVPVSQVDPKHKESAWRKKNLVDTTVPPLSPKPPKFRSQSPTSKRTTSTNQSLENSSPTNVNQLKIASSSAVKNSFKVVSKNPKPEEREKIKKKETRSSKTNRINKEVKDIPMLATHNRYVTPNRPTVYTPTFSQAKDPEPPMVLYPTVLPKRVPPATYTIKSSNTTDEDTKEALKAQQDVDAELMGTTAVDIVASTSNPELVACDGPTVLDIHYPIGGKGKDSEVKIEETSGLMETVQSRLTRLDKLSAGKKGNGINDLFCDATLMNGRQVPGPNGIDQSIDVVLCAAPTAYASLDQGGYRKHPEKAVYQKQDQMRQGLSASPAKRIPSPTNVRADSRDQRTKPASPMKDFNKRNSMNSSGYAKSNQQADFRTSKDTNIRKQVANESPKKGSSPLRVDDKYKSAIEEKLGSWARSRPASSNRSATAEQASSHDRLRNKNIVSPKPNVIKKSAPKTKDKSPERSKQSSGMLASAATTAAATAVATAAATAVSGALNTSKLGQQQPVVSQKPASDIDSAVARDPAAHRSPSPTWKMEKEGIFKTGIPSPVLVSPKQKENAQQPADDAAVVQVSPKTSPFAAFKDKMKQKLAPANKGIKAQPTANIETGEENAENAEDLNCVENYCSNPAQYVKAATMMGEMP